MDEFRGIQTALFLMLLLQFTGAATGQSYLFLAVRDGDEVTLPCNSVRDDQNNCDSTTWLYSDSSSRTVVLVTDGQIDKQAEDKSDRLSVTENCSLVIKKVTEEEDAGQYDCRRIRSGQRLSPDAVVYLSVVTMTEQKNSDEVTLTCSVSILYRRCKHTVKWLFQGLDVDKDNTEIKTSQSLCSASVTFRTSHYILTSSYQSLKCNVTDRVTRTPQLFPFRLSGEETTPESPTPESPTPEPPTPESPESPATESPTPESTESPTLESPTPESPTPESPTPESPTPESPTPESPTPESPTPESTESPTTSGNSTAAGWWWWLIIVFVGVAALLIIIMAVIRWKRAKGNQTQRDENMADPEEGVSYTSVSYTKKTSSKAQVLVKGDDDEGDAVTYSTVKASSSSSASANPSELYATVNKPNK